MSTMTGKQLKALRKRLGWTQAQLAQRLKVRSMTVSLWERSTKIPEARVPSLLKLEKQP